MRSTIRYASILAVVALLAPLAQAADEVPAPNINKRGEDEKAFIKKLTNAIVSNARTSIKSANVDKYEKKEPKKDRVEYIIKASFKTAALKREATADIKVIVDTSDKDKWEVLRIDYDDTVKSLAKVNRENLNKLVPRLNGK
jgi:hypothetical protein